MNQDELRARFAQLPTLPTDTRYWTLKRAEIRERILREDDVRDFLGWSLIVATFFVTEAPYISRERRALIDSGRWERWGLGALEEMAGYSTGSLVHQAYHLHKWEETIGKQVARLKRISEIGAGYGAMARIVRQAGFDGEYTIYDFPEFQLLQQYYLGQFGVEVVFKDAAFRAQRQDLLIALWSLSEMPPLERKKYETIKSKHYLMASQYNFEETDNNNYYRNRGLRQEHINHLQGDFYLFG